MCAILTFAFIFSHAVEFACRLLVPMAFALFNAVYWPSLYYGTGAVDHA